MIITLNEMPTLTTKFFSTSSDPFKFLRTFKQKSSSSLLISLPHLHHNHPVMPPLLLPPTRPESSASLWENHATLGCKSSDPPVNLDFSVSFFWGGVFSWRTRTIHIDESKRNLFVLKSKLRNLACRTVVTLEKPSLASEICVLILFPAAAH